MKANEKIRSDSSNEEHGFLDKYVKHNVINYVELFSDEVMDYEVDTDRLGTVNYVNLDNAATTPPFASVQKTVDEYLISYGSVHRGTGAKSILSTEIYEQTREGIKDFVGAPEGSYVIYSSNTTGAINNLAYFFSFLDGKVAVSEIEHSSSWLPWVKTEGERSIGSLRVDFADIAKTQMKIQIEGRKNVVQYPLSDEGEFDIEAIEEMLKTEKIKAFVLTASSNVTGYCPDIKKIGEIVHKYGAQFVVDACQFMQHHRVDMTGMGIDFLVASGHKFYAPYGGGFAIGPKEFFDAFLPYQIGGGNLPYITGEGEFLRYQTQLAHDPGTPNAVGAVAMAAALNQLSAIGIENVEKYESDLAKRCYDALRVNSKVNLLVNDNDLSTVILFTIDGIPSGEVSRRLNDEYGIGVRAGSFCAYDMMRKLIGVTDESKIVEAVKNGDTSLIPNAVRASVSICNVQEDIDRFVAAINQITDEGSKQ